MVRNPRWLLLLSLAGCAKPASLPEQPIDDPSTRTTTAFNAPSSPQEMAVKCDVPFYPGAKAPDGMSRMPRREADGSMHYELVLTTSDAPQKVSDYYASQLKLSALSQGPGFSIVGKSPHHNDVLMEIVPEGGQTVIRIHAISYKA